MAEQKRNDGPLFVYPCQPLHVSTFRQSAHISDLATPQSSLPASSLQVSPRHGSTPNLCSVCKGFDFWSLNPRRGRGGHQLHENLAELGECAKTCPLCRHAVFVIEDRGTRHPAGRRWATKSGVLNSEYQARVFHGWGWNYDGGLTIAISPVGTNGIEVPVDSMGHGSFISWFRLRTFHGDPAEKFYVRTVRPVGTYTGSQLTLNYALIWIKECLSSQDSVTDCCHIKHDEDHEALANFRHSQNKSGRAGPEMRQNDTEPPSLHQLKCEIDFLYRSKRLSTLQPQDIQTQRPSRLVYIATLPEDIGDLLDTDELDLKLVQTPSVDVAYAALTYTWGKSTPIWRTALSNIIARQERLPFHDLPLTLQQAVTTTARLGLHYIWIDSICIVQDDIEDWKRESLRMANVYQNALVTIAADNSEDSRSGLYNTISTTLFNPQESFEIDTLCRNGETSRLFLFNDLRSETNDFSCLRNLGDLVSHSKLRDRAWAFQERKLSPRILHFASDKLWWECHHGITEGEDEYTALGARDTLRKLEIRMKGLTNDPETIKRAQERLMNHWYKIMVSGDYSHRTLTRVDDKLVAISGVAKAVAAMLSNSTDESNRSPHNTAGDLSYYIAGHFRACIIESLCWQRDGAGQKTSDDMYRAPSWSWASQNSAVSYLAYPRHRSENDGRARFLDAGFEHERDRQWINVDKGRGWLHLEAKVQPGLVLVDEGYDGTNRESPPFLFPSIFISAPMEKGSLLIMPGRQYSRYVQLDDDNHREGGSIPVSVIMLTEKPGEPLACLICQEVVSDDDCDEYQKFRRIGFVESIQQYRSAATQVQSDKVDEFMDWRDRVNSLFVELDGRGAASLVEEEYSSIVLV